MYVSTGFWTPEDTERLGELVNAAVPLGQRSEKKLDKLGKETVYSKVPDVDWQRIAVNFEARTGWDCKIKW